MLSINRDSKDKYETARNPVFPISYFQFGFMSRIIEFVFKEIKRITFYIVVEDLENKLSKLADPYTLTTTTPPKKVK